MKPGVLLSFEVVAQAGALNAQDTFAATVNQLQISQEFLQKIIDENGKDPATRSSSFLAYIAKHGGDT